MEGGMYIGGTAAGGRKGRGGGERDDLTAWVCWNIGKELYTQQLKKTLHF